MDDQLKPGMDIPDFTFNTPWQRNLVFQDGLNYGRALLIFLRYWGCPLCQLKISEFVADGRRFRKNGIALFVVVQSPPATVRANINEIDIPFTLICDPDGDIYRRFGVKTVSIFRYVTPRVLKKVAEAKKKGIRHGPKEGLERQLPAAFYITHNRIAYAAYGTNIADLPDNAALFEIVAKSPTDGKSEL